MKTREEYNAYKRKWRKDHKGTEYKGMKPVCYEEWLSNEHPEIYEEIIYCRYFKQ